MPPRRRRSKLLPAATVALVLGTASLAQTQAFPREDLPPALRPWVAWVLDQAPTQGCPAVQGEPVCVWPGRLRLALDGSGGTFSLDLQADRDADLRLPGSHDRWPQGVALDGREAPVFERQGAPFVRVAAGRRRVTGRFAWSGLPESLPVPPQIGLVDLALDGRTVARPRREAGGLLWLRARAESAAAEGDSLRLQVFRRIADGIPPFVETRIQLEVAGRAREMRFPEAAPSGTVVVSVGGDLPARVEDGTLRVQLRGGRYGVRVLARVEGDPDAFERPAQPAAPTPGWPPREVWVFAADETLRQVELSGPPAVDPSRTELPGEWRALPAFLVEPGGRLAVKTVRRGQPHAGPDALRLTRELWLDPDGRGASVRDRFGGTLHAASRLDLLPPGSLGRVNVDGQDQLVTENPETHAAGVELRRADVELEADSRLDLGGPLSAVGWSTGVEQLATTLHLPPGWSVLGSSGVDRLGGTWTSRWTLLGFFWVLLVAFAADRLFGRRHAALAAATLVLSYGEPGAPLLVWLSLLGAIALRRVAPEGRLASLGRIWYLASAGVLVVLLVPFARDQVKAALYPQVARTGAAEGLAVTGGAAGRAPAAPPQDEAARDRVGALGYAAKQAPAAPPPRQARGNAAASAEAVLRDVEEAVEVVESAPAISPLSSYYASNVALEQDPKAVVQTGPGVPSWSWSTYALSWSGPVGRDHHVRLFLASPGLNRGLTVLRLALLGLLAYALLTGRWPRLPRRSGAVGATAALLAGLCLAAAPARAADEPTTPSPRILDELRQRLTRPAPCQPSCVTTPSAVLRLGGGRLEVSAEVHAAADGSWAVPGPLSSWAASEIVVDGAPGVAAALLGGGFLHVRLGPGVHRIEASGPAPPGDSFTLQFVDPPRRARAEAPGWDVSGLRADGPADGSVLFSRRLATRVGAAAAEGTYAPWLEVTRTLGFGVTWTVHTRIRRVTPRGAPVAVRVPLLPGEAPTRANLVVEDGEVAVSLGRDDVETGWQSTLEQAPEIGLAAPEDRPWSEVWRLQCSPVWSCDAEGLPPVARVADGVLAPEFRPWPGESLRIALAHPAGVEGRTLTLDSASLESSPGARSEKAQLALQARSSREQPLVVSIPPEAEVQRVTLDGAERPARPDNGELRLTVPAGAHRIEVQWQQPRGIAIAHTLPRVGLSAPAVNVSEQLTLPPNRWLILTHGPAWGPAVLFWPYLVCVIAVALALGRLPGGPLTTAQWILLGLGLSQVPSFGALVVAGFAFALAARARRPPSAPAVFDLVQLGLGVWALVSLALLYAAIHTGLLFRPDMQVAGHGSSDTVLRWYADRVSDTVPAAGVVSLPLWTYRILMLAWALWLAGALVRAAGPGWRAFSQGGVWRPLVLRRRPARPPVPSPPEASGPAPPDAAKSQRGVEPDRAPGAE